MSAEEVQEAGLAAGAAPSDGYPVTAVPLSSLFPIVNGSLAAAENTNEFHDFIIGMWLKSKLKSEKAYDPVFR